MREELIGKIATWGAMPGPIGEPGRSAGHGEIIAATRDDLLVRVAGERHMLLVRLRDPSLRLFDSEEDRAAAEN